MSLNADLDLDKLESWFGNDACGKGRTGASVLVSILIVLLVSTIGTSKFMFALRYDCVVLLLGVVDWGRG